MAITFCGLAATVSSPLPPVESKTLVVGKTRASIPAKKPMGSGVEYALLNLLSVDCTSSVGCVW